MEKPGPTQERGERQLHMTENISQSFKIIRADLESTYPDWKDDKGMLKDAGERKMELICYLRNFTL